MLPLNANQSINQSINKHFRQYAIKLSLFVDFLVNLRMLKIEQKIRELLSRNVNVFTVHPDFKIQH